MSASFTNGVLETQNALVSLIATFTDPNGGTTTSGKTLAECGFDSTDLPYVWVRRGRHTGRNEMASDLYGDVRQYQALVYVSALCGDEMKDEPEFDLAVNWIKPFHKFLAQNRNNVIEGVQIDIANVRDSGDVSLFAKNGNRFSGVAFTIPMIMITRF